jgi:hypothetical protein
MYSEYCSEWKKNKNINPITKRAIAENGTIYKQFVKHCDKELSIKNNIKNFCDKNKKLKEFINSQDEEYYKQLMQFCKSILKEQKPELFTEKQQNNNTTIIKYLDSKLTNNECIKLTKNPNQYLLNDNILLFEKIGSDSVYGIVYKSMIIDKPDIPYFVTKIQLNTKQFANENRVLLKIMKLLKIQNIPVIPYIYKIITCNNLIIDNRYPAVLAKANKTNKKYSMILYEFAANDLQNFLIKNSNLDEKIWKNMYEQIFMSIFVYHSVFNELHADTHIKNFLYRKITPGGCFCYNINGINYYIENLGYVWMIWDYGNSQPLNKLSNPSWIEDYIVFNLGTRIYNEEINKSDFFKVHAIHADKQFGYLPKNYIIPKTILNLQENLAEYIYYKTYKKAQSNNKYFMPNTQGSVTEYEWFIKLFESKLLFSKSPIGEIISTTTFTNPNIYYYNK